MPNPKRTPDWPEVMLVPERPHERARAWRTIGLWLFVGFDIAFFGYLFTGVGWWFLLPVPAFVIAWRIAYEQWPFFASRE